MLFNIKDSDVEWLHFVYTLTAYLQTFELSHAGVATSAKENTARQAPARIYGRIRRLTLDLFWYAAELHRAELHRALKGGTS